MEIAGKALMALLWLYVVGVLVQFFLAGLAMPQLGDQGWETHRAFGWSALHVTPIIFLVLGAVAKLPRVTLIMLAVFAVVSILQPFWATEFEGEAIAALHVLGAAIILAMAHALARIVTRQVRHGAE